MLENPSFKVGTSFEEYTHNDFLNASIETSATDIEKIGSIKLSMRTTNTATEIDAWYKRLKGRNLAVQISFFDGRSIWLNPMQLTISYNSGEVAGETPSVNLEFRLAKFVDFGLPVHIKTNIIKTATVDCADENNIKLVVTAYPNLTLVSFGLHESPEKLDEPYLITPMVFDTNTPSITIDSLPNNTSTYLVAKYNNSAVAYDIMKIDIACVYLKVEFVSVVVENVIKPNNLTEMGMTDAEII